MSSISQLHQIACKNLSVIPTNHHRLTTNKPSYFSFNQSGGALPRHIHQKPKVQQLKTMPGSMIRARFGFSVRALDDDSGAVAVPEVVEAETVETLKKDLVELFYGTERGLNASSETRAEIAELISKIEPQNPTPAPKDSVSKLDGNWILVYTSYAGLFPLLSSNALPLVNVDKISQSIDSENFTVESSVQFKSPLGTTSFSTNAKFEVRSPMRVQIMLEEGVIGTPQLTEPIVVPENIRFFGQVVDLSPYKSLLTVIEDSAASIAKTISSQPPLKFPFQYSSPDSWYVTTYVDEDLCIARGDGGSVFVLIKEGSPLLG